jgi:predicted DNA-binding protein (MmcQ/YjbR family)
MAKPRVPAQLAAAETALRAHAMAKPAATEHFPWGERAIKVAGKVFLFMSADATSLGLSVKLPASSAMALMLPFAVPTGYGLGKAGWVSASFAPAAQPPVDLLCAWIDESYQAIAPAKLAKAAGSSTEMPVASAAKQKAKTKRAVSPPAKRATKRAATSPKKPANASAKRATRAAKPKAKTKGAVSSPAKRAAKR